MPSQPPQTFSYLNEAFSRRNLPDRFLEVLPQSAVQPTFFPSGIPQNSIWDFVRSPDGRFFLSLCAEGFVSASGQVYEYLPEKSKFRICFDLKRECMASSRAI